MWRLKAAKMEFEWHPGDPFHRIYSSTATFVLVLDIMSTTRGGGKRALSLSLGERPLSGLRDPRNFGWPGAEPLGDLRITLAGL